MSIIELPKTTSRLLSSTQVITTSAALVKELLDNALDAKAASIEIIISADTIDKIEVRDNGHGICPQDLNVIGKRGYTSKLRNFDELKTIGGQSLGFRGGALSSALELANVSITTRVEGEAVATAIKLKSHGGFESQTSISHPVGTTIRVTKLFSKLPVRKQTALKCASKTISTIKSMLQSYVLARVNVRLTLKVLKSGNSAWSFAPLAKESMRELVSQIIGRDIATQCFEMISTVPIPPQNDKGVRGLGGDTSVDSNPYMSSDVKLPEFTIQAFLPRPDADLTKIKGSQYVSIDSRPLSSARGTVKRIISIYKKKIAAISGDGFQDQTKSPFIRLNIICPRGSYDPNVEPAKDDILFENEELVLSIIEDWLSSVYQNRKESISSSSKPSSSHGEAHGTARPIATVDISGMNSDVLYSTASKTESSQVAGEITSHLTQPVLKLFPECARINQAELLNCADIQNVLQDLGRPRQSFDMSADYLDNNGVDGDDKMCVRECDISKEHKSKQNCRNHNPLNPWLIAKLNAPITNSNPRQPRLVGFMKEADRDWPPTTPTIPIMLPTPRRSSTLRRSTDNINLASPKGQSLQNIAVPEDSHVSIERWLKRNHELSLDTVTQLHDVPGSPPETPNQWKSRREIGYAGISRGARSKLLQSPPATQARFNRRELFNVNEPFVPTRRTDRPGILPATETKFKTVSLRRSQSTAISKIVDRKANDSIHEFEHGSDVYDALDFERRKEAATRKLREELRGSHPGIELATDMKTKNRDSLPLKNRIATVIAALDLNLNPYASDKPDDRIMARTSLADDNPRAYLMRRQSSNPASSEEPQKGRRLKRMRSMLLPLESIPDKIALHNLRDEVSTNINSVRKAMLTLKNYDQYVRSGIQERGLDVPKTDIVRVKTRVKSLMKSWGQIITDEEIGATLDFRDMQGKSMADA